MVHGAHRGEWKEDGCASVHTWANTLVTHLELGRGCAGLLDAVGGGAWASFHRASTCASTRRLHGGEGEMVRESDGLVHASVWHMHGYEGVACGILGDPRHHRTPQGTCE